MIPCASFVEGLNQTEDLPTLGSDQTDRSVKGGLLFVDLSTFIVAVFCLIDDRIRDLGHLRRRGPTPTLCDSEGPHYLKVVGEFLGLDEDTELFAYPSGATTPTSSQTSDRCIAPPSPGRRPTSGRLRNTSGKGSWPRSPTIPPSPWRTLSPCRCACSPEPTAVGVLGERRPSAKTRSSQQIAMMVRRVS